jgi:hypothetical protein
VSGKTCEDSCDLRRSLPFAENHLGHTGSESAMMIDFGETEIFEREMSQASYSIIGQ